MVSNKNLKDYGLNLVFYILGKNSRGGQRRAGMVFGNILLDLSFLSCSAHFMVAKWLPPAALCAHPGQEIKVCAHFSGLWWE